MAESTTDAKDVNQDPSELNDLGKPVPTEEQNTDSITPKQSNTPTAGTQVPHGTLAKDAEDIRPAAGRPSKEERIVQDSDDLTPQRTTSTSAEPPFSIYTLTQRRLLVWVTALAGFIVRPPEFDDKYSTDHFLYRVRCLRQSTIQRSMISPEIFIRRRH